MSDIASGEAESATPSRWLVPLEELVGVTRHPGGVARQYAAILPRLDAWGVQVEVMVISSRDTEPEADLGFPVTVLRPPAWARGVLAMAWGAWQVRRAVRRGSFDAVLAPEWTGLAAFVPARVPQVTNLVTGARLLDEISGFRRRRLLTRLSRRVQYALEARQIRQASALIAISTAVKDWYTKPGFDLRTEPAVIPNCIDVAHVSSAARTAPLPADWPAVGPTLLFVGRLERRKGIDDVVEAFRHAVQEVPDLTLVLAGAFGEPGVELDEAGLRSALGPAADRTVVLGPVPGDALYRAMAEADLVVCPSRWEAFGLVALEAKAAGGVVVVTRGSGFDDFCQDGVDCRMVEPASPRELARSIVDLLARADERVRLRAAAQASAWELVPDRVVPRYVGVVLDRQVDVEGGRSAGSG